MGLSTYLTEERVIFLRGHSKIDAFDELAEKLSEDIEEIDKASLLDEIWKREMFLPTRVASNIAMPHAIIREVAHSVVAFGISKRGIPYEDSKDDLPVRILVMLIGNDTEHLPILTEISSKLSNKELCEDILRASTPGEVFGLLTEPYVRRRRVGRDRSLPKAEAFIRQAMLLAEETGASRIVLHADAIDNTSYMRKIDPEKEVIIVTGDKSLFGAEVFKTRPVVFVPFNRANRSAQVEVSLLFLLSQGLVKKGDRAVSVFGYPQSGNFDSIFFTDVDKEFKLYFAFESEDRPDDLSQQVFTRVLQLASELATEGREGKAVGTLFVVGDYENVRRYCQQLIINPFQGYREEERNILDPSLEDTIKEYSRIDGAFVIRGDGVIVSAGTYIRADSPVAHFQAGLGARHAAAATVSSMTRALAVTVSESTQAISLFRSGERFLHF
ncbi:MAG TPA: PTS sugar transporter subunit IIA [Spirochaetia bacterium]|nr:PTS sugar transporter subunit IIA [Spirochaetia bacterium]